MKTKNRLLLAIPKKGRLSASSENILKKAGLDFQKNFRSDIAPCQNLALTVVFLPAKDIPNYVSQGEVDLGISGKDLILESQVRVVEKLALDYGRCSLCLLSPEKSKIKLDNTESLTIATSFPNLTKKFLQKKIKQLKIIQLSGSVEIACRLGLSDLIVDLVETGETLKSANLKIQESLLESEALLIMNPNTKHHKLAEQVSLRIAGISKANSYALIEYNIQRKNLVQGEKLTPGGTSPTIMPLENSDWVAVKSLIKKESAAELMEKLESIGAKDILVCSIENCRIGKTEH